jgi:hypothetical protein
MEIEAASSKPLKPAKTKKDRESTPPPAEEKDKEIMQKMKIGE